MINKLKLGKQTANKHKCEGKKSGDWIVFTCPHCPDFERKIHTKTGEMKTKSNPNNNYKHNGSYIPNMLVGGFGPN